MTNIYELPERVDAIEEASHWLTRLDRGLNAEEEKALQQWLAAHPRNPATLMEVAQLWDKLGSLSMLAELFPEPVHVQPKPSRIAWVAAASIMVVALVGLWISGPDRSAEPRSAPPVVEAAKDHVFETGIGESNTVMLPDGSRMILNTDSLVRVRFAAHHRLLMLERGEVFLQVAHDPSRPLRVQIGDRVVEALGTAFNLKITEDQRIELIVTEGKVLVGVVDKEKVDARQEAASVASPASATTVSAGERMLLTEEDAEPQAVEPSEIEVKLSWRAGNLIFRGESLEEALAEIERYTQVEFVILDEDLKKVRVVGMFKGGDVEGLLATLRQNFDIAYERVGNKEIILTKP